MLELDVGANQSAPDVGSAGGLPDESRLVRPLPDGRSAGAYALFQQPWWLDAAAPGAWDVAEIRRDGEVIGRLPYVRRRRMGLTVLHQPRLTPYLGPWIGEGAGKYNARVAHQHDVLRALVDALPAHDIFTQTCHPTLSNCLALHWRGFTELAGYTYAIDDLGDLDRLWGELAANARTKIRKAEQQAAVRTSDDIDTLIRLNRMTYARQGIAPPYPDDLVRRIDDACGRQSARQLLVAEGEDGQPHAAVYIVWDEAGAYGLIGGSDPARRRSGADYLLKWETIKFASRMCRRFDCAGSMLEPIEPVVRMLGTRQVRYARLVRGRTLRGRVALAVNDLRGSRH